MRKQPLYCKVIRHITTCRDNESFDAAKVAGLATWVMLNIFTIYDLLVIGNDFNAATYGGACTSIITGTCLGIYFKKDTEPTGEESKDANCA